MTTTRILFTRHEEHTPNQVLTPDAHERAVERGRQLKVRGYAITAVVCSPQLRAVRTALAMLWGNEADPMIEIEDRLGDLKTDPRFSRGEFEKVKALAIERHGDESDSSLAKILTAEYPRIMIERAREGAQALNDIAIRHVGQTILVVSHGVARMEVALRHLRGERDEGVLQIMDYLLDRGEVVEITFKLELLGQELLPEEL